MPDGCYNVTYQMRFMVVIGLAVWGQIAMLGIGQICRAIRLVTFIIMIYTIGGTIWWLVIFSRAVWSPQLEACANVALFDPASNYLNVKTPLLNNEAMPTAAA